MKRPVILHPHAVEFYQYRLGVRFDPGAMAEAFEPRFANPVLNVVSGRGKIAGHMMVTQHPQVWFNRLMGRVGVPTQAGQIISQPLLDLTKD